MGFSPRLARNNGQRYLALFGIAGDWGILRVYPQIMSSQQQTHDWAQVSIRLHFSRMSFFVGVPCGSPRNSASAGGSVEGGFTF
jgi:hypothetical protein